MTRLFRELTMSQSQTPDQGSAKAFVQEASKKGFGLTVRDFFRFAEMAKGRDMGQVVRELRESGDIDDNLFGQLQQRASGFMSLIKMFK